jgi:N utilization substance protein B
MLNRRHLRIKVLQALYAWFQGSDGDFGKSEKELMKSIDKIYDLYVLYLLFLVDIRQHAINKIEEGRNKKLPRPEDLDPNTKFVDNKVLELLSDNRNLLAESSKRKLNWMRDQDLVRKIFNDIRNSELYTKYMNDPGRGFDMDQDFLVHLFKEEIANSETLLNHLEEMSINWMDDIDLVCSTVIKTIKGFNPNSDEFAKLSPLYKDPEDDEKFVRDLFKRSVILNEETEALISSKTENWELERIASMDMLLMKMAITEVLEFSTIPVKVTLNEYIEISKFYSTPKSNGFINGILDKVFLQLKTDNRIKKIGRGLLEG